MIYDPVIEAENHNIFVHETELCGINGYYRRTKQEAIMLVEKSLSFVEKRFVVEHELQHHKYTAGTLQNKAITYRDRLYREAHEKFIDRKAAEKLIPEDKLKNYIEDNPEATVWDVAEFFYTTERMVHVRIESLLLEGKL